MSEETIFQERRLSQLQARKALRKANNKRQYNSNAVGRFRTKTSEIIDLFALFVEEQMIKAPNTGQGCRVTEHHIETANHKLQQVIIEYMEKERKLMRDVKLALEEEE